MHKPILLLILFFLCINAIHGQFQMNSVLKDLDNMKEVKSNYGNDYLKHHEYFDKRGNLIFSKGYLENGEIASIHYNEYTDEDELAMMISLSTISDLSLVYYDRSTEGMVKTCTSSKWKNRKPYDRKTKKFLQKVGTVEELLKRKEVKKLIKKKKKCGGEIHLDSKGRKIKQTHRKLKNGKVPAVTYEYDASNNITKTTSTNLTQKNPKPTKTHYEYDKAGNRIKTKTLTLISNADGVEEWVVTDSTQTKYNSQNQMIEQLSTRKFGSGPEGVKKTIWQYDENNRLIQKIAYDVHGEKKYGTTYTYIDRHTINKQTIYYEQLKNDPDYEPTEVIFRIEYYDE